MRECISSLFRCLEGEWTFSRVITDNTKTHAGLPLVSVVGRAEFKSPTVDCLAYTERGEFSAQGQSNREIRQDLTYRYDGADGVIVSFSGIKGGGVFHQLVFDSGCGDRQAVTANGLHLCGMDRYQTHYLFCPPRRFQISHCVSGPRKNYVSVTHYTR